MSHFCATMNNPYFFLTLLDVDFTDEVESNFESFCDQLAKITTNTKRERLLHAHLVSGVNAYLEAMQEVGSLDEKFVRHIYFEDLRSFK